MNSTEGQRLSQKYTERVYQNSMLQCTSAPGPTQSRRERDMSEMFFVEQFTESSEPNDLKYAKDA